MSDPYALLATFAERERTLALEGRLDELELLAAQRAELVAGLPARAPQGARAALVQAAAAQAAAEEALRGAVDRARRELAALDRGRTASRAYGASSVDAPSASLKFSA